MQLSSPVRAPTAPESPAPPGKPPPPRAAVAPNSSLLPDDQSSVNSAKKRVWNEEDRAWGTPESSFDREPSIDGKLKLSRGHLDWKPPSTAEGAENGESRAGSADIEGDGNRSSSSSNDFLAPWPSDLKLRPSEELFRLRQLLRHLTLRWRSQEAAAAEADARAASRERPPLDVSMYSPPASRSLEHNGRSLLAPPSGDKMPENRPSGLSGNDAWMEDPTTPLTRRRSTADVNAARALINTFFGPPPPRRSSTSSLSSERNSNRNGEVPIESSRQPWPAWLTRRGSMDSAGGAAAAAAALEEGSTTTAGSNPARTLAGAHQQELELPSSRNSSRRWSWNLWPSVVTDNQLDSLSGSHSAPVSPAGADYHTNHSSNKSSSRDRRGFHRSASDPSSNASSSSSSSGALSSIWALPQRLRRSVALRSDQDLGDLSLRSLREAQLWEHKPSKRHSRGRNSSGHELDEEEGGGSAAGAGRGGVMGGKSPRIWAGPSRGAAGRRATMELLELERLLAAGHTLTPEQHTHIADLADHYRAKQVLLLGRRYFY